MTTRGLAMQLHCTAMGVKVVSIVVFQIFVLSRAEMKNFI